MLKSNKAFYVYAYLDPRKPGKHIYGEYEFNYEPFYIGKGCGNRKNEHLSEAKGNKKSHKLNKIRNIITQGLYPIIIICKGSMLENNAIFLEIKMISSIGRADLKLGPLTNLTNGGDGLSGYICTEELKIIRSNAIKGSNNYMYGKNHSKQTIETISNTRKKKIKSGEIIPTKHTEEWKNNLKNNNPSAKKVDEESIIRLNNKGEISGEPIKDVKIFSLESVF